APTLGEAYVDAMAAGARAYHAGRYEEAAHAYDLAAGQALRVKDRDEARFLEARTLERADRFAEAKRVYEKLIADSPQGPRTIRAVFDIAEIEIAHGDADKGCSLLEAAAVKYPMHGLARPSILRILDHTSEHGGDAAALAWLDAHAATFRSGELD